jgi:hypothetical protein
MLHEAQQVFAAQTLDLQRFPELSFKVHLAHTFYGRYIPEGAEFGMYVSKQLGLLDRCAAGEGNDDPGSLPCGLLETQHPVYSTARVQERSVKLSTDCTKAALSKTGKVVGFGGFCLVGPI